MQDQSLVMFVILETGPIPAKPKINALYDSEERAQRRFCEIAERKSKELTENHQPKEEGSTYEYVVEDAPEVPPHILMSKNIVCEITKIIPAGYFTAVQTIKSRIPMLCLDLHRGCERVSLQKHELALRQWREAEDEMVWKVQAYASQHAWIEERKAESDLRAMECESEISRLESILDTLEASVAKLNSENARLTAENSKLQLENLGLYRSLQSPQQVGPFTSTPTPLQPAAQRQPALFLVGPPYPEHFMAELRKKIIARK